MGTREATKWVYEFSEGSRDMRDLLGGTDLEEFAGLEQSEVVPAVVVLALLSISIVRTTEPP